MTIVSLRHPNRLRRHVAGVNRHKREVRSRESGRKQLKLQNRRSEEFMKLSPTTRMLCKIWLAWFVRRQEQLLQRYLQSWWLTLFRGRSLDRIIQILERLRRTKLRMAERVRLGLFRSRLRRRWGRNYYHLTPKSRGGNARAQNLMLIKLTRHTGWHILFKDEHNRDMTLDEVIALLTSYRQMLKNRWIPVTSCQ